jgi:hypothetical protein
MIGFYVFLLGVFLFVVVAYSAPKAIVHIGPPKTASSTLQLFLDRNMKDIQDAFLSEGKVIERHKPGGFVRVIEDNGITDDQKIVKFQSFLKRSINAKTNVVISSEEMSLLKLDHIKGLKSFFDGFDVTVVFVYREWLSHLVSVHNQRNKNLEDGRLSHPFSEFLFTEMDNIPLGLGVNPLLDMETITNYASVFGRENVTIIDMVGTAAANVPIERVFVCDIMGVLCARDDLFRSNPSANVHEDLVFVVLQSLFQARLRLHSSSSSSSSKFFFSSSSSSSKSCHFCDQTLNGFDFLTTSYKNQLTAATATATAGVPVQTEQQQLLLPLFPLPLTRSRLTLLLPHARKHDAELRQRFGDRMLYGNQTANFADMEQHVHVEELDVQRFLADSRWLRWMDDLIAQARHDKLLCDC